MDALYPLVVQHLIKAGSFFRADSEHASNDMPTFSRQNAEETPGTLDDLLALGISGRPPREWRCLFACRLLCGLLVATSITITVVAFRPFLSILRRPVFFAGGRFRFDLFLFLFCGPMRIAPLGRSGPPAVWCWRMLTFTVRKINA